MGIDLPPDCWELLSRQSGVISRRQAVSYRVAAASDLEPIPLCAACRRELRQVGTNFWSAFGLDRTALIKRYNRLYEELHPKISVKAAKEAAHK